MLRSCNSLSVRNSPSWAMYRSVAVINDGSKGFSSTRPVNAAISSKWPAIIASKQDERDKYVMNRRASFIVGMALLSAVMLLPAASAASAEAMDFRRDVWPIFQTRCVECHGPKAQKSSLRVDSRAALIRGGESGAAIAAGDPDKSYLLELVSAGEG